MSVRRVLLISTWIATVAGGCGSDGSAGDPDAGTADGAVDVDAAYPAPRSDLVPAVGTDQTLDIATWNVENFPRLPTTPRFLADLIVSLDIDLIAMQEIEDTAAFEELVERLRGYEGELSTHTYGNGTYQKLGFIYKSSLISVGPSVLLFNQDGYEFPRPPLQIIATVDDGVHAPVDFIAIALHLKAGRGSEDGARRQAAIQMLEQHVRQTVDGAGETDVLLLGDFNEVITSSTGQARFAPFLDNEARYAVHTSDLAAAGGESFLPSGVILDHIVSTASLADEFATGVDVIPPLDVQFNAYVSAVSDHLPMIARMPIFQ